MRTRSAFEESIESKIQAERVRLLYRQSPILFAGILILIVSMVWFLWGEVERSSLLLWLGCNIGLTAARAVLVAIFSNRKVPVCQMEAWGWVFALASGLSGLIWGSLAFWALNPESVDNVVFIVTVLSAMAAASLIALSSWVQAYFAYAVSSMTCLIAGLITSGGATFLFLAALIAGSLLAHLFFAVVMHRNIRETLLLRFENIGLVHDLQRQKEMAEKANLDKSRFLAATSHDLRQPLHALDLFMGSLGRILTSDEQRSLMEKARQSSHALGELLNALLDISKLDSGAVRAEIATFAIAPLIDEIADEFCGQAQEAGLSLRHRASEGVVRSDPILLGRMIRNLVSNAVHHTTSGGVFIGCRKRGETLRVEVRDTGPGIDECEHDKIFSEFYQLGNPERDRGKGLGLGLAIVKRFSSLLGHPVSVKSRPGQGSCFSIDVPLASIPGEFNRKDHEQAIQVEVSGLFVLVIDDEIQIREGMRVLLRDWDYEVLLAESGDGALGELRKHDYPEPAVIVADCRLREQHNGIEAVKQVREYFGRNIPAIIVTGDIAAGMDEHARDAGCDILFKPVGPEALHAAIAKAVSA
ncbi:MAG: hybrid sensor histidine kinase/response regulator [Mariprofundaceae bacterium]